MNVWPMIARELRSEARRPSTYWLRVGGAAALLSVGIWFAMEGGLEMGEGARLFRAMHLALLSLIWIGVPLMTADCISVEKRQGTLGLLFLTTLRAGDIVVAKGLAHGLRATALVMAVVPVLIVPVLLGGVSGLDTALAVLGHLASLCWAMAAGLVASAWAKTRVRALALAELLAWGLLALFLVLLAGLVAFSLEHVSSTSLSPKWFYPVVVGRSVDLVPTLAAGFNFLTDLEGGRSDLLRVVFPGAVQSAVLFGFVSTAALSLGALAAATQFAARRLQRSWQPEPPSARQMEWTRMFCTPVYWVSFLHRWLRRILERNPIGWLERRTWSGRLLGWSWLSVLLGFYLFLLMDFDVEKAVFHRLQQLLAWVLGLSIAMTAAGSFRRERETGLLELLLVSPLTERQIIGGRLRGVWGQFLPAVALLFGVWLYLANTLWQRGVAGLIGFFAVTYLTVPIVGLYFSLRCRTALAAFLWTALVGLLAALGLPGFVVVVVDNLVLPISQSPSLRGWLWNHSRAPLGAFFQLAVALYLAYKLHRDLCGRRFALGTAG